MKDIALFFLYGFGLLIPVFLCVFIIFIFLFIYLKIAEKLRRKELKNELHRWREAVAVSVLLSGGIINWSFHEIVGSGQSQFLKDFGNGIFCMLVSLLIALFVVNILLWLWRCVFGKRSGDKKMLQTVALISSYYVALCIYGTMIFGRLTIRLFDG